ncbi:4212_t:CDS:2, partial [Scutellospora calospora]
MESFIAITIHFIDNQWKLQHFVLDIFQFKGSHTRQNIADKIYNLLEEFEIDTKVIALTTDNAHILNLVVSARLKFLETPIKKLRKLVKIIQKSTKYLEYLENIVIVKKQFFLVPVLDCKTRWNSTYFMLKRAYNKDWIKFKNLIQLLEQFNEATIELLAQSYPTIAYVQIILLALRKDLESNKYDNFQLDNVIEAMLSKYIDKNFCFPNITIEEILTPVREKIQQQLPLISSQSSKKISSFYQKLKNNTQELQLLFEEADEIINLLDWWQTHTAEYLSLSKLAQNFLCIQASSVLCEQLFSIASQ